MRKLFFLLPLIIIIIIEFSSCKKADTGSGPFASSDTTQWVFNGVTDTAGDFSQFFGSFSFSNSNGDGMSFEFGSLPFGNQTYSVVTATATPGSSQCYLSVTTGIDNVTYYSTGAPGDKVVLKTTGNKEVFSFYNITVSADGVTKKKVSGAIVE